MLHASFLSLLNSVESVSQIKRYVGAVAVLSLLLALSGNAFAQGGNAQLGGLVEDPSKALVPGVTVTAKNVGTGVATRQITNDTGVYSFPALQPGTYEVSAELPGFKKAVQKAELPYAGQVRVNFTLELGQTSQTVDVQVSAASVLRESSGSVSDVLTLQKIESLPLRRWTKVSPSESIG